MAALSESTPSLLLSGTSVDTLSDDGYPLEIFVEQPARNYICRYCKKVVRSPHQLECGHRYCQFCIKQIVSDSENPVCCVEDCEEAISEGFSRDHAARRDIEKSTVYCYNRSKGCSVTLKLKELDKHLLECDFALIDCMHKNRGCSVQMERRHLADHLSSECQYRQVTCEYCQESMSYEDLKHHIEKCDAAPVACPNDCGVKDLARQELDQHLEKCPMQRSTCHFNEYGCEFRGSFTELQKHVSQSTSEHLVLVTESHSRLELRLSQVDRRCTELENQRSVMESKNRQQAEELDEAKQRVEHLEEKVKALEIQSGKTEDKVRDSHKSVASMNDRMMKIEHDLTQKAKKDDIEECKRLSMAVQETCRRLDGRVDTMESERLRVRTTGGVHAADIEEIRKTLSQIGTQLGMHDIRLAEQDIKFQILETACYDGILIWKIKDYTRRKHEAVVGKTLSLYSQPFYTSRYGYKMCARVYLNGDGMGKNTHMSLFFVVMRGDYDALLDWPFRQKVTLILLDQDTGRRNLSDTFKPDPTSSSFKRPTSDMNIASGCPLFVSQSVLETPAYVKNDTLFVKMIVDTSDLYGP